MTKKTGPNCNGTNVAEIMYWLPTQEFMKELDKEKNKGKYRLRGCCISYDDPSFSCNDCGELSGHRDEEE